MKGTNYCECGNWWPYAGRCEDCAWGAQITTRPEALFDRWADRLIFCLILFSVTWFVGAAALWAFGGFWSWLLG